MLEYTDLLNDLPPHQQALFVAEYHGVRKDPPTALLWNLFLGGLGAHHFYLGNIGAAVLYLLFSWTFIPLAISFFELFAITGRTRRHNRRHAELIAARLHALNGTTPTHPLRATVNIVPDRIRTRHSPALAGGLIMIGILMAIGAIISLLGP